MIHDSDSDVRANRVFRVALLLPLIIVTAALGIYTRSKIETSGDRKRIAAHIRQLTQYAKANPTDKQPINDLRRILNSDWSFARVHACGAIGDLGAIAKAALPDLLQALNCGDLFVEREAARSLGFVAAGIQGVEKTEVVNALIAKLVQEDHDSAWFAADSLGDLGASAAPAIPALNRAARSQCEQMALSAEAALKKLKPFSSSLPSDLAPNGDL